MGNVEKYNGTINVTIRERSRERVGPCDFFVDVLINFLLGSMSHYHTSYRYKSQEWVPMYVTGIKTKKTTLLRGKASN